MYQKPSLVIESQHQNDCLLFVCTYCKFKIRGEYVHQTPIRTFTHWLLNLIDLLIVLSGHAWCNMFHILSILEVSHSDVIIVIMSSLVTLVTGCCVPWLHVKQTRNGVDNCAWIPVFHLLMFKGRITEVIYIRDMNPITICQIRGYKLNLI